MQKLFEAQNYEDMFAFLSPILHSTDRTKINETIRWAKQTLRRKDRVTWYLRLYRVELVGSLLSDWTDTLRNASEIKTMAQLDFANKQLHRRLLDLFTAGKPMIDNLKPHWIEKGIRPQLTHIMQMTQHVDSMRDYVFDKQSSSALLEDLYRLERAWQETASEHVQIRDQHNVVISFPDGFAWVNLGTHSCEDEAGAMGHCGNSGGDPDDRILSLRKLNTKAGTARPSLTFILDQDGYLGEMKGRENNKPAAKYHPYILKLLESPLVNGLKGGGYEPEHNFSLSDLTEDQRQALYKIKPTMMDCLTYFNHHGVDAVLQKKVQVSLEALDVDLTFEGFEMVNGTYEFVVDSGESFWFDYIKEYGDESVGNTVDYLTSGQYSENLGHRYESWLVDMVESFPQMIIDKIVDYAWTEHADEIRAFANETDADYEATEEEILKFIQEENEPMDIYEALNQAYNDGEESGTAEQIMKALEKVRDEMTVLEMTKDGDGNWMLTISPAKICQLIVEDKIDSRWGEDDADDISVNEPHDGWREFSRKAALDSYLENCPPEVEPEKVILKPVDSLTREEMIADMARMRNSTPEELARRYNHDSDDTLRFYVRRAREKTYGYTDNETVTESYVRQARALCEDNGIRTLGDIARVTVGRDADFWLVRRGSEETVGTPTNEFNPQHIAIKVTRRDIILPDYLFYVLQYLHSQGYWKTRCSGSTRLVGIRTQDVKDLHLART